MNGLQKSTNMYIRQTSSSELSRSVSVLVNSVFLWGWKSSGEEEMFVFFPLTNQQSGADNTP